MLLLDGRPPAPQPAGQRRVLRSVWRPRALRRGTWCWPPLAALWIRPCEADGGDPGTRVRPRDPALPARGSRGEAGYPGFGLRLSAQSLNPIIPQSLSPFPAPCCVLPRPATDPHAPTLPPSPVRGFLLLAPCSPRPPRRPAWVNRRMSWPRQTPPRRPAWADFNPPASVTAALSQPQPLPYQRFAVGRVRRERLDAIDAALPYRRFAAGCVPGRG